MRNCLTNSVRTALLLLLLMAPALAEQITEWSSSTGSTIRMIGTENWDFQIQVMKPDGQSLIYPAYWIETKNSFGYEVNGQQYYCTYNNGGWGIQVDTGNGVTQWTFVRWISK